MSDDYNKYIKYKTKYINLKNHKDILLGGTIAERIELTLKKNDSLKNLILKEIKPNNLEMEVSRADNIVTIKMNINNKEIIYNIDASPKYGAQPMHSINGCKFRNIGGINSIIHNLKHIFSTHICLIFCHPEKYSDDTYWYTPLLKEQILSLDINYDDVRKITIDPHQNSTADIIDDAFKNELISLFEDRCDVIYLPDCSGQIFDIQLMIKIIDGVQKQIGYPNLLDDEKKIVRENYINLLGKTLKMLKKGGLLYASKIIINDIELLQKEFQEQFPDYVVRVTDDDPNIAQYVSTGTRIIIKKNK